MKKAVLGIVFVFTAIFFIGPAFATTSDIGLKPEILPAVPVETIIPATSSSAPVIAPSFTPTGIYELALFDKNGGVQVAGKIIFDSYDKESLKDFRFTIPGENINLVRVLHEKSDFKKVCSPEPNCYDSFVSKFTTLNPKTEKTDAGLKVTVNAKPNLSSQSQESLVFYFRTSFYTKKILGSYRFNIPSIQVPYTSADMQFGILAKEGLILRGAVPNSGYYYSPVFNLIEKAKNLSDTESLDMTGMFNDIMYQGQLRKTESDLPPDTSFTVKGVYGSFWLLLFLKEILIAAVLLALLVLAVIFLVRKYFGKSNQAKFIVLNILISFITSLVVAIASFLIYFLLKSQGVIMM